MRERERMSEEDERGEAEGDADSPPSREPMRDPIPGLQDYDLSRRQLLNQPSHPGAPEYKFYLLYETRRPWK